MKIKNILFYSFCLCLTTIHTTYAEDDGSKGIGYRSPIVVKDKVTFNYVRELQSLLESANSVALDSSISTTGLNSFETSKAACVLEASTNTSLDFMDKNKQFLDQKHLKSMYSTTNKNMSKAKKITQGRCSEVFSILNKQYEVFKRITQQEMMNYIRNSE